jgi:hypothetical protein
MLKVETAGFVTFFFLRYAKSGDGQLLLIFLLYIFISFLFFRRGWYAKVETAGVVAGGDLACIF